MTISTYDNSVGFKRCAVCKIDLKGRFVYVDDGIENLLGRTKEELFGKSFMDFLNKKSRKLIKHLISKRNHYETYYDTTVITIIGHDQEPIVAGVVVNLNFIAGNPVNYQIIINPQESSSAVTAGSDHNQVYSQFLENMLEIDGLNDVKRFVRLLLEFTRASQVAVYKIGENELEPRAAATDDNSAEFTFKSIPRHGQIHRDVAQSGKKYSCVDQDDAQEAVEKYGLAPDEYLVRFIPDEESGYLLRLIFSEKGDTDLISEAIQRAELALTLYMKLAGSPKTASDEGDSSIDMNFTIGFLDSLGVGAVLTDRGGKITGFNPAFLRLIGEDDVDGDYRHVVEKLRPMNPKALIEEIMSSLQAPVEEPEFEDFRTQIMLPGNETAILVVVRFSLDPTDLSSCLAFIPSSKNEGNRILSGGSILPLGEIMKSIKSVILSIKGFSGDLAHEFFSRLGDGGNDSLRCLDENSRALGTMINDLSVLVEQMESANQTELVDLNLVVNHALQDVLGSVPEAIVKCHYKKLPKIVGSRTLLVTVMRNLISNAVRFNREPQTVVRIKAHIEGRWCVLDISDNGSGIPEIYRPKVFDFFYTVPDSTSSPLPGSGSGLAICKHLIEKIGGSISLTSKEGEGTTVSIKLPIQDNKRAEK